MLIKRCRIVNERIGTIKTIRMGWAFAFCGFFQARDAEIVGLETAFSALQIGRFRARRALHRLPRRRCVSCQERMIARYVAGASSRTAAIHSAQPS